MDRGPDGQKDINFYNANTLTNRPMQKEGQNDFHKDRRTDRQKDKQTVGRMNKIKNEGTNIIAFTRTETESYDT